MKVHVKHTAGSFWPDAITVVKCVWVFYWYKVTGVRNVKVDLEFDKPYCKHGVERLDWCKSFGSKSGFKTEKNNEWIIAYRYKTEGWQTAYYLRKKEAFSVHNGASKHYRSRNIELLHKYPAIPWAGGDTPPLNDFSYYMTITKIK